MKAVVITANGEFIEKEFTNKVGAMISEYFPDGLEIVRPKRLSPEYCMVLDDNGYAKGLDINPVGSYLYCSDENGHHIVGDIILLRITRPHIFALSKSDVQYLKSEYALMASVGQRIKTHKRLGAQAWN